MPTINHIPRAESRAHNAMTTRESVRNPQENSQSIRSDKTYHVGLRSAMPARCPDPALVAGDRERACTRGHRTILNSVTTSNVKVELPVEASAVRRAQHMIL
ncbi:hypothetical protein ALC53_06664 [Atta colombica]|uniref:Uncharacterized protein n=1 Tax=Atta colombica TaxID=520822 RepID=A0A195BFJ1_9HYME|nr:hypothetical protein ALC53_06664 [Atta colombica]